MFGFVVNGRVVVTDNSHHYFVLWGDGEGARQIGYIVVALHRFTRRCDGVCADHFTHLSVQRIVNHTCCIVILQAANCSGQYRIKLVGYFLFVIGFHRCGGSCDGERARHVGHRVVTLFSIARGCDGVGASILTCFAG